MVTCDGQVSTKFCPCSVCSRASWLNLTLCHSILYVDFKWENVKYVCIAVDDIPSANYASYF